MTNDLNSNNTNRKLNNLLENDYLDLNNTLKGIVRRKKYFFTFSSVTFFVVILVTFFNRIFNPVYLGSFTLLINDPLSIKESKSYRPNEEEFLEKLAKNNTNVDIPTLIEYLKSPALIRKIAKKYDYKISYLRNNIKVKTGGKLSNNQEDKADGDKYTHLPLVHLVGHQRTFLSVTARIASSCDMCLSNILLRIALGCRESFS